MGAQGTAMSLRILGTEREVIVYGTTWAVRIAHQRTAVLPAAEHLGGKPVLRDG